ncbi:hypothetical protein AB3N61_01255 [Leptospira sp. WS58.C1]|uniref:hypothetical protein n=1 Tax=Leptospira TaxID=171 RepID=UPI00055A7245|nr:MULTISPECIES: hypothetical protein [unclassified Leptospira]MCR1794026.1 hypothetical protein [Leptospira sp. id769339]
MIHFHKHNFTPLIRDRFDLTSVEVSVSSSLSSYVSNALFLDDRDGGLGQTEVVAMGFSLDFFNKNWFETEKK